MARTPLIAGNWKLNLDHLEATHTVQKLAWLLRDAKHDFSKVEVAVLPSFTSMRSVQTLVDADKLDLKYGAQDVSEHTSGAYTGEVAGSQLAKLGCDLRGRGPLGAPPVPRGDRRGRGGQDQGRLRQRHRSDRVRGRGPGHPQGG